MPQAPLISLTRTTVYDVDNDLDMESDRVDYLKEEVVLAYVPTGGKYKQQVIDVLNVLAKDINDGADLPGGLPDNGSGNPPATP